MLGVRDMLKFSGAGVSHSSEMLLERGGLGLSGIRLLWLYWRGTKSVVAVSGLW